MDYLKEIVIMMMNVLEIFYVEQITAFLYFQKMQIAAINLKIFWQQQPLARWPLWNFIECQAKFNKVSYQNDHIQRIFWYLVRLYKSELSKIGNFQNSNLFFEAKINLIFLEVIFLSEYQSRKTTFNKTICNFKAF